MSAGPVPAVDDWARPARMVPVELLLAGDVLVLSPTVERTVAATAGHRVGHRVEQWVTFTDGRAEKWEHGLYVHQRVAETDR